MTVTLKSVFEAVAKQYSSKTAVVMGDCRLSYKELDEASNRIANALLEMGIKKGERIAVLLNNSPEFVIVYFGIIKAGAIVVPMDNRYKPAELTAIFDNCQPVAIVSTGQVLEPLVSTLPRFSYLKHIINLTSPSEGQFISYDDIMARSSAQRTRIEPEPEDLAQISYASGPTYHPKGVMLTHRNIVAAATLGGNSFQQTTEDVVMLFALPMHYVFGFVVVALASITRGCTVIMTPGLSIGSLWETVEREKCTTFTGVPFTYALANTIAEREGIGHDISSLRLCVSSGAALPVDVLYRFKQLYGKDIIEGFGMTEFPVLSILQPVDGTGKPGSCGKAIPGCRLRIVDDDGRDLPVNQSGEMIIAGLPMMKGFYNNPEATAKVIKNGWLYTGDIGKIDEDGYVFITGRKKEMIIAKGKNIYPSDIEYVLYQYPKVAEAAVVGIADETRGEIIRAVVSLKKGETATEQEIKQFCLERLANYKVPKQVVFLDSLPKNRDGLIRKEDLKD